MNPKISILCFPQRQEANKLTLNVLAVPRNFSPLEDNAVDTLSPAWVDATLRLQAVIIPSLTDYPYMDHPEQVVRDLPGIKMHADARKVFTYLDHPDRFDIKHKPSSNAIKPGDTLRKYLPESYRSSFHFTRPQNPHLAVVNDEYRCAMDNKKGYDPTFKSSGNQVSWGKVFAYCLRQPELAKRCGLIHTNLQIEFDEAHFKTGGWLYVDLHPDCSYYTDPRDKSFIKTYAARIPKLKIDGIRIPVCI